MTILLVIILLCLSVFAYCKTMAELNPQFEEYMIQAMKVISCH